MKKEFEEIFIRAGLEYVTALDFEDCRVINPRLLNKLSFSPKSVIAFLVPYFVDEPLNFSAYAASLDYHTVINEIGKGLLGELGALNPKNSFALFADHSPIDERGAAAFGGLGIIGDNRLLINEKYGTYVFIAEIISDLDVEAIGEAENKEIKYCEHCNRCKGACPSGALREPLNPCLSAITQKKGELSEEEIKIMLDADTVWGCDACQRVCPHNSSVALTPISAFYGERITRLTTAEIEKMSDEDFFVRAFSWRGKNTVLRNLKYLGY